jgi:hypothetical protein
MSVEIKELVIRTVIDNAGTRSFGDPNPDYKELEKLKEMKEDIISECVFRLNQKIKKLQER